MADYQADIQSFVQQVRRRLNRYLCLDLLIRCVGGAAALFLIIGACYLLRGSHVPRYWYPLVFIPALVLVSILASVYRRTFREAARHADRFFRLDDTVCAYDGFKRAGRQGELYNLQAEQTALAVARVSVRDLKYPWPKRTCSACAILLLFSALLTLKADSPHVVQARQQANQTLQATEQINEEIVETLEEIEEEVKTEEEEGPITGDEDLQEQLAELQQTADLQEALEQYADLEKQLHKTINRLEQRRNERLYREMGKSLRHRDGSDTLGEQLAQGQYREAAEELQAYQINQNASAAEQQQQLQDLQSLAEAMTEKSQQENSSCQAAELTEKLAEAIENLNRAFEKVESAETQADTVTEDTPKTNETSKQTRDSRSSERDKSKERQNLPSKGDPKGPTAEQSDSERESPETPKDPSPSSPQEQSESVEIAESEIKGNPMEGPELDLELSESLPKSESPIKDVNLAEPLEKKEISETVSADREDAEVRMSELPEVKTSPPDQQPATPSDSGPVDPNATFTEGPEAPDSAPKVRTSDPLDTISKVVDIKDQDPVTEPNEGKAILVDDVNEVNSAIDAVAEHLNHMDTQSKMISKIKQLCATLSQHQGELGLPGSGQSDQASAEGEGKGKGQEQGKGEGKTPGEGQGEEKGEGKGKMEGNAEGRGQGEAKGKPKGEGKGKGDKKGEGRGEGQRGKQGDGGEKPGPGTGDNNADGGRDPGSGSSNKTNTQVTDMPATGEKIKLEGIPGQGPGKTKTMKADHGSGSRSAGKSRQAKQYRQQAESFVRREDVSEAVKSGVKEYFESIHKTEGGN